MPTLDNNESKSGCQTSSWLQYHIGSSNDDYHKWARKRDGQSREGSAMKASKPSRVPGSAVLPKPRPVLYKSHSAVELRPGTTPLSRTRPKGSSNGLRTNDFWWIGNKGEGQVTHSQIARPNTTIGKSRDRLPSGGIQGNGLPLIPPANVKPAPRTAKGSSRINRPLGKMRNDNHLTFKPKASYSLVDYPEIDPDITGNLMFVKVNNNPEVLNIRTHYTHIHTRINLENPLGLNYRHIKKEAVLSNSSANESCDIESVHSLDSDLSSVSATDTHPTVTVPNNGSALPGINRDLDGKLQERDSHSSGYAETLSHENNTLQPGTVTDSDYVDKHTLSPLADSNPVEDPVQDVPAGDKSDLTNGTSASPIDVASPLENQTQGSDVQVKDKLSKANLCMSDYFCVDLTEEEKGKEQHLTEAFPVGFDLPVQAPTLKLVHADNKASLDGIKGKNETKDVSYKLDVGGGGLDENANSVVGKIKRSVRFMEENKVHEYEPWEPIGGNEYSEEGVPMPDVINIQELLDCKDNSSNQELSIGKGTDIESNGNDINGDMIHLSHGVSHLSTSTKSDFVVSTSTHINTDQNSGNIENSSKTAGHSDQNAEDVSEDSKESMDDMQSLYIEPQLKVDKLSDDAVFVTDT